MKKFFVPFLALMSCNVVSAQIQKLYGDFNNDGKITALDITYMANIILGLQNPVFISGNYELIESPSDHVPDAFNSILQGLVFQPEIYVDGIPATEYTYLRYVPLDPKGDVFTVPYMDQIISISPDFLWGYACVGDLTNVLSWPNVYNYSSLSSNCSGLTNTNEEHGFAVAKQGKSVVNVGDHILNTVTFAKNPANAKVSIEDASFAVRNIMSTTRANEASMKIVSIDESTKPGFAIITYYVPSADIFRLITANNDASQSVLQKQENTTAFKLHCTSSDKEIESEWAAIYETSIQPVAIALNAKARKAAWYAPINCSGRSSICNELHKNPYEAISDINSTVNIEYNSAGVDIAEHIELHFLKRDLEKGDRKDRTELVDVMHPHITMTLAEAAYRFGFTYEFSLVPYALGSIGINQSSYAHLKDGSYTNSVIVPNTVDVSRYTPTANPFAYYPQPATAYSMNACDGYEQGLASVGQRPLVQILVKKGEDVILDGYTCFEIYRTPTNVLAPLYDLGTKELAASAQFFLSKNFELIVYNQAASLLMTKQDFEDNYRLVTYDQWKIDPIDGLSKQTLMQFSLIIDESGAVTLAPCHTSNILFDVFPQFSGSSREVGMTLDFVTQKRVCEMNYNSSTIYVAYRHKTNGDMIVVPLKLSVVL